MTNPNRTLIATVLDRSGSIAAIRSDIEGGLNTYIESQKNQPGECEFFLAQFDDQYEVAVPYMPISLVGSIPVIPRGSTALLDAIGRTITEVGARLAEMPPSERPGHVIMPIVTDGIENASREFTRNQIFDMISHQRDTYGWEFLFLAANQDAIATGARMGFTKGSSLTYAPTSHGISSAFAAASTYSTVTRSGSRHSFSDADRDDAVDGN